MLMTYNESEGCHIMGDAICRGAVEQISDEVNKKARAGYIESHILQDSLKRVGMIGDMDANRITQVLEHDKKVDVTRFHQFV